MHSRRLCKLFCTHEQMVNEPVSPQSFVLKHSLPPLPHETVFLRNTVTILQLKCRAMIDFRRSFRRFLGRDPHAVSSPIPSPSPVTNSSSFTAQGTAAAATPSETERTPLSRDSSRELSSVATTESEHTIGAHGPLATP